MTTLDTEPTLDLAPLPASSAAPKSEPSLLDHAFSASAPAASRTDGSDTLDGTSGSDTLDGGAGADSMSGGDGSDTYYVDNALDVVVETELGIEDTVWSSASTFTLAANVETFIAFASAGDVSGTGNGEDNHMLGNEGQNNLSGGDGSDVILGGAGNDTIDGGAGFMDIISGGEGADVLTGGAGHDFFNYETLAHAGDTITDFHTHAGAEDDMLDLRPLFATFTNTAGVASVEDAVASGHLRYEQAGADTKVYADADGGGDGFVELVTLTSTSATDVQIYTLI